MHRLSHTARTPRPAAQSVAGLLQRLTRRLQRARLHYGHGTDNARDEAAALIWHALRLPRRPSAARLRRAVTPRQRAALDALLKRRISERMPAVYLTHRCWFAGLEFYVDERVLIPRSPLAELIQRGFAPWIDPGRVRRVADVGTGSGCIAIACARAFPRAEVDALELSPGALEVARRNIRRHRLAGRVRALHSDHFSALAGESYEDRKSTRLNSSH